MSKKEKMYTFAEVMESRNEAKQRIRIIIEYLLNKNSHPLPRGIDYKQFYEDMEEFENSLIE